MSDLPETFRSPYLIKFRLVGVLFLFVGTALFLAASKAADVRWDDGVRLALNQFGALLVAASLGFLLYSSRVVIQMEKRTFELRRNWCGLNVFRRVLPFDSIDGVVLVRHKWGVHEKLVDAIKEDVAPNQLFLVSGKRKVFLDDIRDETRLRRLAEDLSDLLGVKIKERSGRDWV